VDDATGAETASYFLLSSSTIAMRRVASRVARKTSMWTCALRDGSLEDVFDEDAPPTATTLAETAARALRVKLVDEICRGRTSTGRRGVEEVGRGGGTVKTTTASDDARAERVGEATRRVAATPNAEEEGDDEDVARVEAVVAFVLEYCAEILRPTNGERTAMPPLGTHVVRRVALASDETLSAYFQEQCSFDASPTTADHFIDGRRQRVHASAKISVRPRVVSVGSTVVVHLDAPPPSERARARGVRDGCCFVEFRGCSGHPDYLRRRSTTPDDESEVFEFNLPSIRITGLARGWPTAELVGDVFVRSTTTSTKASLKFREFDVDSSPSFRNVVSGTIASDSKTVKRLILGTWDTRVLLGGVSRDDARAERRINLCVEGAPPLTTATGVQSLLPALRDPAVMTNRRLWQSIVEAMRTAKIREPERSATREILGETPPVAVAEKLAEGARMTYELAVIVADAPPEDEEPPLPRYWNPRADADAEDRHE